MYNYSSSYNTRTSDIKVKDNEGPLDTVSSLVWHKYSQDFLFFSTSWDGYVRCYQIKNPSSSNNTQIEGVWKFFLEHPVLCCDIHEKNVLFVGMATGDIAAINLQNNQVKRIGGHDAPICGIFWVAEKGCLISFGYDNLVRFWDITKDRGIPQFQVKLPLKTHTTSFDYPYLLIGSCQSTVAIVNIKNLPNVKFPKEPQNYHKTSIQVFSKFNCSSISSPAKMIAVGTMDGRTLHANFKDSYDDITFEAMVSRSQKKADSRNGLFGQVNAVDVCYRNYQGFCFIGGTQDLVGYNLRKKSKGPTFNTNNGPTTALKLHPTQDLLIFATGTDWTKGIHQLQNIKRPKIYLSKITASQMNDMVGK